MLLQLLKKNLLIATAVIITASLVMSCSSAEKKAAVPVKANGIIILVDEEIDGVKSPSGMTMTGTLTSEILKKQGFNVLDNTSPEENLSQCVTDTLQKDVTRQCLAFAADRKDAAVVIYVLVRAYKVTGMEKYLGDMVSMQVNIRMKAVDLKTSAVIAAASRNAAGLHIDKTAAAQKGAEKWMKEIFGSWEADSYRISRPGEFLVKLSAYR